MDCVNHTGITATAYCQHCGKALCPACVRSAPGGQIFCEPCFQRWQSVQTPFVPPPMGTPSPGLAALLGFIPGVGAMYNGQFLKGLVHVFIFAVLVSASHVSGFFGLCIAGWVFYQVFEAYHTAKARRDGEPLPDPLGLNEIGHMFGAGTRPFTPPPPGPPPPPAAGNPAAYQTQPPYQAPYEAPPQNPGTQGQWQQTWQGQGAPPPGVPPYDPNLPPMPPPHYWRRREPVGAVILIALGIMFLLDRFDLFSGHLVAYTWPLVLIGLGVWLLIRRLNEAQGGPK